MGLTKLQVINNKTKKNTHTHTHQMSTFTITKVPYVPEWAQDVIFARIQSKLRNGVSCFAVVRRKAIPIEEKTGQQEFEWITSKSWRATKCLRHKSIECTCSQQVCTCKKRCRCMDAEIRAYKSVGKPPRKMSFLKEIQVYSELRPCKHCEAYFRNLSLTKDMKVTCFWSAKGPSDLIEQFSSFYPKTPRANNFV